MIRQFGRIRICEFRDVKALSTKNNHMTLGGLMPPNGRPIDE